MEVKALIDCEGIGYKLKVDETAKLNKKLAKKLIDFGYVVEVKPQKNEEKGDA
jgi:hypothetical protein